VFVSLTPRQQGDLGEVSAIEWLGYQGASVAVPFGHSPNWDLMAELDGRSIRVQVKTSGQLRDGRWAVAICTRGGNQSWNGLTKVIDPTTCEYLFVLVGDGRRWFIPVEALECRTSLTLGGPKYAEYEVEPGRPFQHERCQRTPLQSPN
jgi:hypothetical protein